MKTFFIKFLSISIMLIGIASSCNNNFDVTDVTLNHETLTLTVNETETLIATVLPADATNKELIWESSDPKVVYVDNTGKITALAEETATITVTTADGGKKASCEVIVSEYTHEYINTLPGTKWKLEGIFDSETDTLIKELEPKGCDECFIFVFMTDSTFYGRTVNNSLGDGKYEFDSKTGNYEIISFIITLVGEMGDGYLYSQILAHNRFFTVEDTNRRILCLTFNDGNNYLKYTEITDYGY